MTKGKRNRNVKQSPPKASSVDTKVHEIEAASSGRAARQQGADNDSYARKSYVVQVIGLLTLIAYTVFTSLMWRNMQDAADREERFFRLAHRARLGGVIIQKIDLRPMMLNEITAHFSNDPASLPAEHVSAWASAMTTDTWKSSLPAKLEFRNSLLGEMPVLVVGPGTGAFVPAVWVGDNAEIAAVKSMRKRLYVYGGVTYTDAFKTKGSLSFCFFYWPPGNDWRYCEKHNDMR